MAFARGPIWPDLTGTPTDPGTAYTAATRFLDLREESEIHAQVVVAGNDTIAIQLLFEVSLDYEATWHTLSRVTIPGATVGTHPIVVVAPQHSQVRVSARRWGGTVNTTLLVTASARRPAAVANHDGQPLELAVHQADGIICWSDGLGAADATGGAFASGPAGDTNWIPVGRATRGVLEIVTVGATTSLELEIVESPDDAVTTYDLEAVNTVIAGIVNTMPRQIQIQSAAGALAAGTYRHEFDVTPGTAFLLRAKDTGASVDLIVRVRLYEV